MELGFPCAFGILLLAGSAGVWKVSANPSQAAPSSPSANASVERGRTLYVLNACSLCHGIAAQSPDGADVVLANYFPRGSRHDLLHNPVIGADVDGDIIWNFVHNGIPGAQVPMPKFRDLTREQVSDIAAFIHMQRRQVRFKELMEMPDGNNDPQAGALFFTGDGKCSSCHQGNDLASKAQGSSNLKASLLRPTAADTPEGREGAQAHQRLLEQYSDEQVQNLLAWLKSQK
jgi:mono/diheme cytochrome c family protein